MQPIDFKRHRVQRADKRRGHSRQPGTPAVSWRPWALITLAALALGYMTYERGIAPASLMSTVSGSCTIKGNISVDGERIYHLPGQRYYNATRISLFRGERWFCSEREAIDAGWRRSRV